MPKFKIIMKILIIQLLIICCFNSCSVFKNEKSYTDGYTIDEYVGGISENNLIGIADTVAVRIYGKVIWRDYTFAEYPSSLQIFLQNTITDSVFTTNSDFDGMYNLYLLPGKYDLLVKKEPHFLESTKISQLELKSGEIREINIETEILTTTVSIEYKGKRAVKRAQRNQKKKNK